MTSTTKGSETYATSVMTDYQG